VDVTLSELAIEMFFPADQATAESVRKAAAWPGANANRERRNHPVM
jgi:hypothetical protein